MAVCYGHIGGLTFITLEAGSCDKSL